MSAPPRLLPLLLSAVALFSTPLHAVLINYENCLDVGIVNSSPLQLQFVPLWFDAKFDTHNSAHNLNVTIYGNVSGQQVEGPYPPADSPVWKNPNETFGKITDVGSSGTKLSTLLADFKVLTYEAYNAKATEFCLSLVNGTCPLGPYFNANASVPAELPSFSVAHDFGAAYRFSTLAGTVRVISGDPSGQDLACVSANITPDLGSSITGLLRWMPAAILLLKGAATLAAAIWSPWGSSDIFRFSSNYGRDEDQLRLVTPGFGDCLQYIQFVTLTGALSLQYPGFYQPAVSQTAWSLLLFNESYVTHGSGTQSLVDGIYVYNGTYGMTAMSQLIGVTSVSDLWACMAIWLLVIAGIVALLCQLGFLGRYLYRTITNTPSEDLRSLNMPFTLGNMIRLLFNYFILPIVSLSLFQLVIADISPTSVIVLAVLLLLVMIVAGAWTLRVIFTTQPRTHLFDDMPTVLLYGPLYNTYSDSAAPFTLLPIFITFMRAVALGAVQPSGIAQLIVLAVCEVILILTLNGFRPFQGQTSMNAYHTFFAVIRLATVLLSVAFVESLGVSEAPKGWIGYAILLLHACVLLFGFFLNAAQTLIEVVARSMGVAGDAQTGAIRGSILNLRMLQKRQDRDLRLGRRGTGRGRGERGGSMTSDAAILQDTSDARSAYNAQGGRSRSLSASSQQLLNQVGGTGTSVHRLSGFEVFAGDTEAGLGEGGLQRSNTAGTRLNGKSDAGQYYRPPRPRRQTTDLLSQAPAGVKTRKSGSEDYPYVDSPSSPPSTAAATSAFHRRSSSGDGPGVESPAPAPAYFRSPHDSSQENLPRTDYAVREVDQYYRGAALSDLPTRKLKTGPADPVGPAANAQSWFTRLVHGVKGGKEKEPSKGFEVVRSSRMPPRGHDEEGTEMQQGEAVRGGYKDSPEMDAGAGAERIVSPIGFDGGPSKSEDSERQGGLYHPELVRDLRGDSATYPTTAAVGTLHPGLRAEQGRPSTTSRPSTDASSRYDADRHSSDDDDAGDFTIHNAQAFEPYRLSAANAPTLGEIEGVGGIDMPSRWGSRSSMRPADTNAEQRDWLRSVDSLNWNQASTDMIGQARGSGTGGTNANAMLRAPPPSAYSSTRNNNNNNDPSIPRRSSRRTPSREISYNHDDVFAGFDSGHTSPDQAASRGGLGGEWLTGTVPAPGGEALRPESYASVGTHRAGDRVSRNSLGVAAGGRGESGVIFGSGSGSEQGEGGRI